MNTDNQSVVTEAPPSILDRISEKDVNDWLVAQLAHLRKTKISSLYYIDVSVHTGYTVNWGMQGGGECVVSCKTMMDAANELHRDILKDPAKKAQEKKEQADLLIAEAKELEQLAATIGK